MTEGARKRQAGVKMVGLVALGLSCVPPRLPPVTVQYHADGTATRGIAASRLESAEAAQRRLLSSIECPNYEVVAVEVGAALGRPPVVYWIRYRCAGKS